MCDICCKEIPYDGICTDCIHWAYCYGCISHETVCGFRYNYYGTLRCLKCINILYETDDEYKEFLEEVNIVTTI